MSFATTISHFAEINARSPARVRKQEFGSPEAHQKYTGSPCAPDSAGSASGPWSFWKRQSSSRSQAGRTLVCSNHSNCRKEKINFKTRKTTLCSGLHPRFEHTPEVGHHKRVLEGWISARVEAVHPTEALAGRPSAQHLHITLLRQLLTKGVGFLSGHDQLQQDVAVLSEHGCTRVVEPERLCCRLPHLNGPQGLGDAFKSKTFAKRRKP